MSTIKIRWNFYINNLTQKISIMKSLISSIYKRKMPIFPFHQIKIKRSIIPQLNSWIIWECVWIIIFIRQFFYETQKLLIIFERAFYAWRKLPCSQQLILLSFSNFSYKHPFILVHLLPFWFPVRHLSLVLDLLELSSARLLAVCQCSTYDLSELL